MKQPLLKKIFLLLLLAFAAATQAVGQTFTTTADLNSPDIYHHSQTVIVSEGENSFTADFKSLYNTLGQELYSGSYVGSFYLRAYIADKSSYAPIADLASWNLAFSSGDLVDAGGNGKISLNRYGGSDAQCVVTGTLPTGVNLADYRLVVLVSKIADGYCAISGWGDGQTITESRVVSIVELDFKTLEQALSEYQMPNINDFSSPHVINIVYQGADDNEAKDLGFYASREQITADFGGSQGYDYTRYIHFFLIDADGNPITNVYESTFTAPSSMTNKDEFVTANGYYVSATNNNTLFTSWGGEDAMKFSFTKPASLQWSDIRVVAILTNDVSGLDVFEGNVLSNPTNLKSAFIFSFQKAGFLHYEGVANAPGEWDEVNGNHLQLTHQWTYNKYVKPGETITLRVPIVDGNIQEPGYYRWYAYQTDAASSHLDITRYGKELEPLHDANSGIDRGLFAWGLSHNPTFETVAAIDYVAPSADWEGESIACDVSRYLDGIDSSTKSLLHEPTLSIRYIYNVYPAQKIADVRPVWFSCHGG